MKKTKKRILVSLLATFILAGCSTTNKKESEKTSSGNKVVHLMEQHEVGSLDTIYTQDEASINTQSNIFEGLYKLDKNDNVVPAVAKELPEVSEDGITYTIKLRKDSKWSNGDTVKAKDFVFAWQKLVNPENQGNYMFLLDGTVKNGSAIINGEKDPSELGIKALDDETLEVTLEKPVPYFTSMLAFAPFFPQNEEYVTSKGKEYGTNSDSIVSNGPFIIKDWNQSSMSWKLEKNKDYYDAKNVKSDLITYEVIKEGNTAFNLFESGDLDMVTLSGDLATNNKDNPNFKAVETSKVYYLKLNQKRNNEDSIFANENVRKAIAYALDKESLVDKIVADGSEDIYGFIPKNFVFNPETKEDFRKEAGELVRTDEAKAKEYLEKAKSELNGPLSFELITPDGDSQKRLAEYIQGQLEETLPDIKVTVKTMPQQNAIELTKKGDYELAIGTWGPDYQDPMSFLENFKQGNNASYYNEKYDTLMDEVSNKYANDPETRWKKMIEAEKVLVEEDAAIIPLFQQSRAQLVNDKLKGVENHNFGATVTLNNIEMTK